MDQLIWIGWLILGVGLIIAEIFTLGFFLLWFGIGALAAALADRWRWTLEGTDAAREVRNGAGVSVTVTPKVISVDLGEPVGRAVRAVGPGGRHVAPRPGGARPRRRPEPRRHRLDGGRLLRPAADDPAPGSDRRATACGAPRRIGHRAFTRGAIGWR